MVILFYKFTPIKNPEAFKIKQKKIAEHYNLRGRMLIAREGINATFEGKTRDIKAYIKKQKQTKLFGDVVFKDSVGNGKGFTKLQVKVRPEVVTLGVGSLNIKKDTAPVVTAQRLEQMYQKNEDFVVLDLRNDFEVQAGYFEKTVNPNLSKFKDLPKKMAELTHLRSKKVVAVCTGGIRCEKATVLLKKEGFTNLYQLKDGIYSYMKKYPGKHFKGTLFTFDNRMVTGVVDGHDNEILADCFYCGPAKRANPAQRGATIHKEFYNDDSVRPSKKVICCDTCIVRHKKLRKCVPA